MREIRGLLLAVVVPLCFAQRLATIGLAGSANDAANGVAVDAAGNVYVAGTSSSFDLPVVNAAQPANRGTPLVSSADAGLSWQPVPAFMPAALSNGANFVIAADPVSRSVLYITGGKTVYKTTDAGARFSATTLPLSSTITSLAIDPSNHDTVYASATTNCGVYKSVDGGTTWTTASRGLPANGFIDSVVIDPFHPKTLWAWAGTGGYVSIDAGATWTLSKMPFPAGTSIFGGVRFQFDNAQPGVIYGPSFSGNSFAIQRSMDGGQTWTPLSTPFTGFNLATDPVRPGYLYAVDSAVFYRSTDFGTIWAAFPLPGSTAARIAVDPADPDVILAGTYRSSDGGRSWTVTSASRDLAPAFSPGGMVFAIAPATSDAFLAKYASDGHTPVFLTYFGGMGNETVAAVKLDPAGNIWIAGTTTSSDLLVNPGALQPALNGSSDIFIAEFSPDGELSYCTYLGGTGPDSINGLAIDLYGDLWITGQTSTRDFPVTTGVVPPASLWSPPTYVFAAKLGLSATKIMFATYIGGTNIEYAGGVVTDPAGNAIVTGTTYSPDFPVTAGAIRAASPPGDGVPRPTLQKFDRQGSLVFSTYIGGTTGVVVTSGFSHVESYENGVATAADRTGIYITGRTSTTDFPVTSGAFQKTLAGGCAYPAFQIYTGMIGTLFEYLYDDVFLMKLSEDGRTLVYSTLLGGSCYDRPTALTLGADGTAYLAGETDSGDFPLLSAVEGAPARGDYKSFVSAIGPDGGTLLFSTYLAAGADPSIALGADGILHVAGRTGLLAQTSSLTRSSFGPLTPSTDAYVAAIDLTSPRPAINLTGVMNGFSFYAGPVAPGEIVAVTAPGFNPPVTADIGLAGLSSLGDTLAGTRVLFDGRPAQLMSVAAGRIFAIAPQDLEPGTNTSIQVVSGDAVSNVLTVNVAATNLGLLSLDGTGTGAANARNADGSLNTPGNPAQRGSTIMLYFTGKDPGSDTVQTNLGMATVAPLVGFVPGIYSALVTIPSSVYPSATFGVTLYAGTVTSQGLTISVQ